MRKWVEDTSTGKIDPRALDPNTYRFFNPDVLYTKHANSYAFVYYPEQNKFVASAYPDFHSHMLTGNKSPTNAEQEREKAINNGLILGRFGVVGNVGDSPGIKVIGFWGNPDKEIVVKVLKSIVKDYPEYASNPDEVMVAGKRPFSNNLLSKWIPNIKEFAGKDSKLKNAEKEDENCDQLGITVDNQFLTLDKVISNLHMVKGVNGELMKSVFCSEFENLKRKAKELGCAASLNLLSDIWSRSNCGNKYDQAKEAGSAAYRSELQKTFSNPSSIDTQFRGRQSEIDKAWDFLRGRRVENFSGFKGWLLNEGKHETQRRRSRRSY